MANRAGRLTLGMSATVQSIRKDRAALLLLAHDASKNASDKMERLARERHVVSMRCGQKGDLGRLLGRQQLGIIGVEDEGFSRSLQQALATREPDIST